MITAAFSNVQCPWAYQSVAGINTEWPPIVSNWSY